MSGDPKQPGCKLRRRLVSRPRPVDAEENLLPQLLGNPVVLDHPIQKVDDRQPVFFQQKREAGCIALLNTKHQLRIVFEGSKRYHVCLNPFVHGRLRLKKAGRADPYSPFRLRSIKRRMASPGGRASNNMACICSVIGISIPCLSARSIAALLVSMPSATICIEPTISSRPFPAANCIPTIRLRLRAPVQVSSRSPRPASPASVRPSPPTASANRVISAKPLVISA